MTKFWQRLRPSTSARSLMTGSLNALFFRLFGLGLLYGFNWLISYYYGTHGLGLYSIAFTLFNLVAVPGRLGLDTASLRFISEYSSQQQGELAEKVYLKAVWLILPVSLGLSVLMFLVAPLLASRVFDNPQLTRSLQLASLCILPTNLLFLNTESLRAVKKIAVYAFLKNTSVPLLACLLLPVLVLAVPSVHASVGVYSLATLLTFALSQVWWRSTRISSASTVTLEGAWSITYGSLLKVSVPMMLVSYLALGLGWADTLLLGIYRSEAEVGIYSLLLRFLNFTNLFFMAVTSYTTPKIAELWGRQDRKALKSLIQNSTLGILLASTPILVGLVFFAPFLLGLFGEAFKSGATTLAVLCVGQFIMFLTGSVGYALQMIGLQNRLQQIILIALILNIVLNLFLIPRYGMMGAAYANVVSSCVVTLFPFFTLKRTLGFYPLGFTGLKVALQKLRA